MRNKGASTIEMELMFGIQEEQNNCILFFKKGKRKEVKEEEAKDQLKGKKPKKRT